MTDRLGEIKERLSEMLSMRSDDFGHDTHALLLAESAALYQLGAALEWAVERIGQLEEIERDGTALYQTVKEQRAYIARLEARLRETLESKFYYDEIYNVILVIYILQSFGIDAGWSHLRIK